MSRIAPLKPPFQKAPKLTPAQKRQGKEYMRRVKELPCIVCTAPGPSDVHHCIHGRFSTSRASDFDTIPLCPECHRYPYPTAIHSGKETWLAQHGPDYGYIPIIRALLSDMEIDF